MVQGAASLRYRYRGVAAAALRLSGFFSWSCGEIAFPIDLLPCKQSVCVLLLEVCMHRRLPAAEGVLHTRYSSASSIFVRNLCEFDAVLMSSGPKSEI